MLNTKQQADYRTLRAQGHTATNALRITRYASPAAEVPSWVSLPTDRGDTTTQELDGYTLTLAIKRDFDFGAPWDNMTCLAEPHQTRSCEQTAGDMILSTTRLGAWRYPLRDAIAAARKEQAAHTKQSRAAIFDAAVRAAKTEADYFRRWLNDQWEYLTIDCELSAPDGTLIAADSCSGIDDVEYAISDYLAPFAAAAEAAIEQHQQATRYPVTHDGI